MYIIKHRSRRARDAGRFYWVVSGAVSCCTIESAVDTLMALQVDMRTM